MDGDANYEQRGSCGTVPGKAAMIKNRKTDEEMLPTPNKLALFTYCVRQIRRKKGG